MMRLEDSIRKPYLWCMGLLVLTIALGSFSLIWFQAKMDQIYDANQLLDQQRLSVERLARHATLLTSESPYLTYDELKEKEQIHHKDTIRYEIKQLSSSQSKLLTLLTSFTSLSPNVARTQAALDSRIDYLYYGSDGLVVRLNAYLQQAESVLVASEHPNEAALKREQVMFSGAMPEQLGMHLDRISRHLDVQQGYFATGFYLTLICALFCGLSAIAVFWRGVGGGLNKQTQRFQDILADSDARVLKADEARKHREEDSLRFLSGISRDLKTPLSSVIGLTQLLQKTAMAPQQSYYVDKIDNASSALLTSLNQLVDFSRIEVGQLVIEKREFSLLFVIDEVIASMRPQAESKNLQLFARVSMDFPKLVLGDADRIKQILTYLLSNAIRYTERGDICLTCRVDSVSDNTANVELLVEDTGEGISAGDMERIFEPFVRSNHTDISGTGLGLTLVRRLLMLMDGTITCSSEEAKGSSFTCRLPLTMADAAHEPADQKALMERLGMLSVMVVDDEPNILDLICALLSRLNVNVLRCTSGDDAFHTLCKEYEAGREIDLVITDWDMPKLNGEQLAKRIQEYLSNAEVMSPKFVLVSAFSAGDAPNYERTIFSGVIKKPFRVESFLETILAIVDIHFSTPIAEVVTQLGLVGKRVLLVEDNEINQIVTKQMLLRHKLTVDVCPNGMEAVSMAHDHDYDVILMDILLPVMDGLDATRQIRSISHCRAVPIIGLTASAGDEIVKKCMAAQMNGYLPKPLDEGAMIKEIVRVLSHKRPPAAVVSNAFQSDINLIERDKLINEFKDSDTCRSLINEILSRYDNLEHEIANLRGTTGERSLYHYIHSLLSVAESAHLTALVKISQQVLKVLDTLHRDLAANEASFDKLSQDTPKPLIPDATIPELIKRNKGVDELVGELIDIWLQTSDSLHVFSKEIALNDKSSMENLSTKNASIMGGYIMPKETD